MADTPTQRELHQKARQLIRKIYELHGKGEHVVSPNVWVRVGCKIDEITAEIDDLIAEVDISTPHNTTE